METIKSLVQGDRNDRDTERLLPLEVGQQPPKYCNMCYVSGQQGIPKKIIDDLNLEYSKQKEDEECSLNKDNYDLNYITNTNINNDNNDVPDNPSTPSQSLMSRRHVDSMNNNQRRIDDTGNESESPSESSPQHRYLNLPASVEEEEVGMTSNNQDNSSPLTESAPTKRDSDTNIDEHSDIREFADMIRTSNAVRNENKGTEPATTISNQNLTTPPDSSVIEDDKKETPSESPVTVLDMDSIMINVLEPLLNDIERNNFTEPIQNSIEKHQRSTSTDNVRKSSIDVEQLLDNIVENDVLESTNNVQEPLNGSPSINTGLFSS